MPFHISCKVKDTCPIIKPEIQAAISKTLNTTMTMIRFLAKGCARFFRDILIDRNHLFNRRKTFDHDLQRLAYFRSGIRAE